MFSRASKRIGAALPSSSATSPSLISEDMNILGNVISEGYVDVNGRLEGNIRCRVLTVRDKGHIKGDVVADTVGIHGTVDGLVKAKHVHLYSGSHITGIIMHVSLSVEDGAFIDGQCKRMDKPSELKHEKTILGQGEHLRLIGDAS
jgi:cytoskeletal protein CcmA (bactofilin family)